MNNTLTQKEGKKQNDKKNREKKKRKRCINEIMKRVCECRKNVRVGKCTKL
jgi:hypothetical protein